MNENRPIENAAGTCNHERVKKPQAYPICELYIWTDDPHFLNVINLFWKRLTA